MSAPHGKSAALKALRVKLAKAQEQVHQLKAERDASKKNTWWWVWEAEYPEEGSHLIAAPTRAEAEKKLRASWGPPCQDYDECEVNVRPATDLDEIEKWFRSEDAAAPRDVTALPVLSPTWPYVLAFAVRMEAKLESDYLEENRHKGDREGWTKDTVHALFERLKEEVDEIDRLLREDPIALQLVPDEAADVANFAMMIADVCGGVKP